MKLIVILMEMANLKRKKMKNRNMPANHNALLMQRNRLKKEAEKLKLLIKKLKREDKAT